MTGTGNDRWALTASVGATTLSVAAGCAADTTRENPLVSGPYAQMFPYAAGLCS